jgi:ABC-type multidrug transport system fused ATPase/permease subunit
MAFLDSNIPLKQVLVGVTAITAFVFSLGQISSRFNAVESTLTNLMSEEESMATKEELNVVGERLSKKIQIQNDQQELIHELELELQELRIRFEEHNHD